MNWKKYKLLIVVGAICVLVSGGLIYWILRSRGQTSQHRDEVTRLQNEKDRLTRGEIYPSPENYGTLREDFELLIERRNALREVILGGQITPPQMSRARFGDYVRTDLLPAIRDGALAATLGGEHGVTLREPTFGLQRFIDGDLPEPGELPELMLRLELTRQITLDLFESGISELIAFAPKAPATETRRPGTARPAADAMFATRQTQRTTVRQEPAEEPEPAVSKEALFDQVTFTVSLRVYEDFFWNMLNTLAANENQLVVSNLRMTNGNRELWPAYLRPPAAAGTGERERPATPRPRDAQDRLGLLEALERSERVDRTTTPTESRVPLVGLDERRLKTTGGELLFVTFDLIVYRLKPAAQGS
ncbi:MAG: Amuc_1100 family pilus-like protein [Verrucomicrobia bacterium]|nr:Amuc_1100 family pilus-like protein [Verrucomicrobiota bacterium]MCH8510322.1 Amuc_1100 family pilus-like protein [Kiritimatiellia bacterium]